MMDEGKENVGGPRSGAGGRAGDRVSGGAAGQEEPAARSGDAGPREAAEPRPAVTRR